MKQEIKIGLKCPNFAILKEQQNKYFARLIKKIREDTKKQISNKREDNSVDLSEILNHKRALEYFMPINLKTHKNDFLGNYNLLKLTQGVET